MEIARYPDEAVASVALAPPPARLNSKSDARNPNPADVGHDLRSIDKAAYC